MKLAAQQLRPLVDRLAAQLSPEDALRLQSLQALVGELGHVTQQTVFDALFASSPSVDAQHKAFKRWADEINTQAQALGLKLKLLVQQAKSIGAARRLVWFEGEPLASLAQPTTELSQLGQQLVAGSKGLPAGTEPRLQLTERRQGKPVVRWFASYAHGDKNAVKLIDKLKTTLGNSPHYSFDVWSDQQIVVGEDWDAQIQQALHESHVGFLLLSHNFLASRYIREQELPAFVAGKAPAAPGKRVVPVALEAFDLGTTDLRGLDARQIFRDGDGQPFSKRRGGGQQDWVNTLSVQVHEMLRRHSDAPPPDAPPAAPKLPAGPRPGKLSAAGMGGCDVDSMPGVVDPRGRLVSLRTTDTAPDARGGEDAGIPVLADLCDWAVDPGAPSLFALLGEYGMGKTISCQRLLREIEARREGSDGSDWPRPLYFDLRRLSGLRGTSLASGEKAAPRLPTLEEIVDECIARGWSLEAERPRAAELIAESRRQAQLWIFDGLDEALVHLSDVDGQAFTRELLRLQPMADRNLHPHTRLLISCRTHFFRSQQAQNHHFTGQERGGTDAGDYRALVMLPFSEAQIRDYLAQALPGLDADATLEMLQSIHNLAELAARPYTLKLVTEFIPEIEQRRAAGQPVYGVTLYGQVVRSWLGRDAGKHHVKPEHKERLMAHLAAWTWARGQRNVPADQLEAWFHDWLDGQPDLKRRYAGVNADKLEEDLRTATFLVRDDAGDGGFRFAHSSMQEYFLARYLFQAAQEDRRPAWALPLVSAETRRFLGECLKEAGDAGTLNTLNRWRAPYLPQASEQWLRYALDAAENGWPAPVLAGVDMSGARLHGWRFEGRDDQPPLNLASARFVGCELRESVWRRVRLEGAVFDDAQMDRCEWQQVQAPRLSARRVNLDGARFRQVQGATQDFTGAQGHRAHWLGGAPPPAWPIAVKRPAAGQCWRAQRGHESGVMACAVSPDGARVVSASSDSSLCLWDATSGECLATWSGHLGDVMACAFSPDGARVVSGSADANLRLWDAASGQCLAAWTGHRDGVMACAFSPDGANVVSASADASLRLWDATSGECLGTWIGHEGAVQACAFSPDGVYVVSASDDASLRLWNATSGQCLATWTGHQDGVMACAFSPDGARVVSASADNTLRLWDAASGECLATWTGHEGWVTACAFSPEGSRVVSAGDDASLRLWDITSGECLAIWTGHTYEVKACAFLPNGTRVVSGGMGASVRLWDVASGECLAILTGRERGISACTFSPDGAHIVSAGQDASLRSWDASSGECLATWTGHQGRIWAVAFSPDGARVVSASQDTCLRLWNATSGECLGTWTGHRGGVMACAFSPDGSRVISASDDASLRLWDATSGECLATWSGHQHEVRACAFSPDGGRVVSTSDDGSLRLWDAGSGECLATWTGHRGGSMACAFSPDGARIVSGGMDASLRLWDTASGQCVTTWTGHQGWIRACAFSPDGARIVSAGQDAVVRLWDAASGQCLATWTGHQGWVWACAFSPDGAHVVSAGMDASLRMWDVKTGQILRIHQLGDGGHAVWEPATNHLIEASGGAWRWLVQQQFDEQGRLIDVKMAEEVITLPYSSLRPLPLVE